MTDTNLIILGSGLVAIVCVVLASALIRLGRPSSSDLARMKADNDALTEANDTLRQIVIERDNRCVEDQKSFTRQMNVIIARDDQIAKMERQIEFLKKSNDALLIRSRRAPT